MLICVRVGVCAYKESIGTTTSGSARNANLPEHGVSPVPVRALTNRGGGWGDGPLRSSKHLPTESAASKSRVQLPVLARQSQQVIIPTNTKT